MLLTRRAAAERRLLEERRSPMTDLRDLDELLRAEHGDAGCAAAAEILAAYVELELAGEDPAHVYPGTAIHFQSCPGCRADHDGLLEAARRSGDIRPE
jgi:hypothetical protein